MLRLSSANPAHEEKTRRSHAELLTDAGPIMTCKYETQTLQFVAAEVKIKYALKKEDR